MPHGLLFVAYVILSLVNSKEYRWNSKKTLVVLISSVIPFGTFYVDYKYLKTDEHRN